MGIFPDIESDLDKLRSQLNPHHLKYHNPAVTIEDVIGTEAENQAADALQVLQTATNIYYILYTMYFILNTRDTNIFRSFFNIYILGGGRY